MAEIANQTSCIALLLIQNLPYTNPHLRLARLSGLNGSGRNGPAVEREKEGGRGDTEPAEEVADTRVEGRQGVAYDYFCEDTTAAWPNARSWSS